MNYLAAALRLAVTVSLIFASFYISYGQGESIYRLPAGTHIRLKMDVRLSSSAASVGDTFTASVARPVTIRDAVMLPAGTVFSGSVTQAVRAGVGAKEGKLAVVIDTLMLGKDIKRSVDADTLTAFKAGSTKQIDALGIAGGAAVGAIIGFALRSTSGALIGAGVGAGIGTGSIFIRKGRDVVINANQSFDIILKSDLVLPVMDY